MRRVMVTGVGAITPIGIGRSELWENLHTDRSGVREITRFDAAPSRSRVAAEVHGFHAENWIAPKAMKRLDRFSRMSIASARMAIADAGLILGDEDTDRIGCMLGSALGGISFGELQYEHYHTSGIKAIDLSLALSVFPGAGSCNICIQIGIHGPASANSDGCASGTIALGRGMQAIREGAADVVLAGATDAPLTPLVFGAFDLLGAMSTQYHDTPERSSRPFDCKRDGFVMGEGSAMLVLESEEHARARGAVCLAEVSGFGLTNDGSAGKGSPREVIEAARSMELALEDAAEQAAGIDVVSAHGLGGVIADAAETEAIKLALGHRAREIPIIATKSRHGHSLGASGAIEASILALGLHHQWLPGALNLAEPSPDCDLNYAINGPVTGPFRTGISNSFGMGGINACVVLRAADLQRDSAVG